MAKKAGVFFLLGFVFYLIFSYYFWSISYGHSVHLDKKNRCYYNLLSEGFLSGMLNLSVDPDPRLLNLPNPYDYVENRLYRLHDVSLYKEKYYLYFGPVPALTLYIPCMLVFGMYMRDHIATLIFSFLSLFWILGIFLYLKEKYFHRVSYLMILFSLFVVAFSNLTPFNLRRPLIYEVAISSAMFFFTGAIYFLCLAFKNEKPKISMLFFSSVFIGLTIGCRPHFIFPSIFLLLISSFRIYKNNIGLKSKSASLISLIAPFISILCLLLVYNYLRFDNPFQFGNKYQLAAMDSKLFKVLDPNSFLPGLYLYLFNPIEINYNFPFIYSRFYLPEWVKPKTPYFYENVSGILTFIPYVFLVLLVSILSFFMPKFKNLIDENSKFPIYEFLIISVPGLLNLLFISSLNGVTLRYGQDFAVYILISSSMLWFYLNTRFNSITFKKIFNLGIFLIGTVSIVFGMALGITGCDKGLKDQNPEEFNKLSTDYNFISEIIFSLQNN